jgi:hypothetical protein
MDYKYMHPFPENVSKEASKVDKDGRLKTCKIMVEKDA